MCREMRNGIRLEQATYSGNRSAGTSSSLTRKKTAVDLFGSVTNHEMSAGGQTWVQGYSLMLGMLGFSSASECMCAGRLFSVETLKWDPTRSPNLQRYEPFEPIANEHKPLHIVLLEL